MKFLLVAGARPNFIKIASIIDAIKTHNKSTQQLIVPYLVHTGQHYDEQMSDAFFKDLNLPKPDVELDVGSSSHAQQTAELMKRFEPVLLQQRPDLVLVVGDVNSTLACSLVASKVVYPRPLGDSQRPRPLVAHVEGGLRSFDRSMPEETNRILTDAISDFIFVTEKSARDNLLREGISAGKIHFVGNTMVDSLLKHKQKAQGSSILSRLGLANSQAQTSKPGNFLSNNAKKSRVRDFALVTLHRPSNVDDRDTFQEVLEALSVIAKKIPIILPVHPRTDKYIKEFSLSEYFTFVTQNGGIKDSAINCLEALGYLDFLCLMSNARLVLTDSGGIQEETTVLGVPCVTLRTNTERPVTITHGTNVLAGTKKEDIIRCALGKLDQPVRPRKPRLWDGRAGERIIKVLVDIIPTQAV